MQYHLNGFCAGDPSISKSLSDRQMASQDVDVLIVGCGPAGLRAGPVPLKRGR